MIDKFNGVFYLIVFLVHFIGMGAYVLQLTTGTKKFTKRFGIDKSAFLIVRMLGAVFFAWILMAFYIMFVRPNGVDGTWGFFTLLFITHVLVFLSNFYSYKIDKTGISKKVTNEVIFAPLFFAVLSALMCYGLSDKIYM